MKKRLVMRLLGMALGLPVLAVAAPAVVPGGKERCQVCGMLVAPYPNWLTVVELRDGRRFFFDGPKDLFVFVFDVPRHLPGASRADIARILVTEYYTARQLPAQEVIFVSGSDVLGPMGQELVPLQGLEQARAFRRDHGGGKLFRFDGNDLLALEGE